ncbi:CrcB family protein [Pseudoroseomonas globiformis]|uniref:Fluoride-specific ion channel FluC n=1 Tax=Teichococcus globiformis TaxID=2307229 RepID=A0ABV7FZW2_9PROT
MSPASPVALVLVAAGGASGAVLRHLLGVLCLMWFGTAWPWATLIVNVSGSAVIGFLTGLAVGPLVLSDAMRLFLVTGVLGGFTTFSAFSLDTGSLAQRSGVAAFAYVALTVGLGLSAFFIFLTLGRRLA